MTAGRNLGQVARPADAGDHPVFTRGGFVVWLLLVLTASVLAGMHWGELAEGGLARAITPYNLLILWLTYPVVKAIHEFGHAFATKVWGGEVHEMGIMLLVLMPIPYVDASAASAFPERRRRLVVGAAGIMVELTLASIALLVWLNASPGIVSAIAYNVMLIAGVSTVLFNGNPLLRFDGYYIFADAVEIPNLSSRSNRYLGYLVQRYVFRARNARSPVSARGERGWFVFFGIASFVYRMFIIFAIALFLAEEYLAVGVALAAWALLTQVLVPLGKGVRFVMSSPHLRRTRAWSIATLGTFAATMFVLLGVLPVPWWSAAQGVVWLPERSQVRAGTACFVERLLEEPDSVVRVGDPLLRCEEPLLRSRERVLEARLRELDALHSSQWVDNRVQADITAEEIETLRADLARTRERIDALTLRSPAHGRLVVPGAQHLPGRQLRQGQVVAYVMEEGQLTVRVVVPQDDIGLVRERSRAVEVRLAEQIDAAYPAVVLREVPAARGRLPSPALGTAAGGAIPVDPADADGLTPFSKVFQLELALPPGTPVTGAGGRVFVRFDHGAEPIALQWYRMVRQLFLRRFSV